MLIEGKQWALFVLLWTSMKCSQCNFPACYINLKTNWLDVSLLAWWFFWLLVFLFLFWTKQVGQAKFIGGENISGDSRCTAGFHKTSVWNKILTNCLFLTSKNAEAKKIGSTFLADLVLHYYIIWSYIPCRFFITLLRYYWRWLTIF